MKGKREDKMKIVGEYGKEEVAKIYVSVMRNGGKDGRL